MGDVSETGQIIIEGGVKAQTVRSPSHALEPSLTKDMGDDSVPVANEAQNAKGETMLIEL